MTVLSIIKYFDNGCNIYLNVPQCNSALAGDIVWRLNNQKPHFIQITFNESRRLAACTLLNVGSRTNFYITLNKNITW